MLNKINKKWWKIIVISIIMISLSFVFAFIFYFFSLVNNYKNTIQTKNNIDTSENYWLGSANPKIDIIYFSDFACPYCKESFFKIREIGINYKKNVKITHKDFPILTEHSIDLALAGRCAGEQGLFWPMHDKLFLNQGVSTKQEILGLANQIGVEKIKFQECFNNKKHLETIEKDIKTGKDLKVTGTPTWFINGQKIEGNIPYDIFINIIEELIN